MPQTLLNLMWASFGMGARDAPMLPVFIKNYLSLNDAYYLGTVIEGVGHVMYIIFLMLAVIVLINMLIAMMSNTFEKVRVSAFCACRCFAVFFKTNQV